MALETSIASASRSARANWPAIVATYQSPDLRRSLWQLANTFVPYLLLWYLMYRTLSVSYLLALPLAIPAAGFAARIFIFFHDCGHGSFFKSPKGNDIVGALCGVVMFTPYYAWRRAHAIHHATAGDLDRRGIGDVKTLTVKEYLALPRWDRLKYRLYRNPVIMFGFTPLMLFLVGHRFTRQVCGSKVGRRERRSVWLTNLALLAVAVGLSALIGWKQYLFIQLSILWVGATAGVWLFYVQHQFEDTYWKYHPEWDYVSAAMDGSSFYKLPKVLQWFTGNIGFHHIHHLSPRIPNYFLEKCHRENPPLQQVATLTFWESIKIATYRLWDEERQKMVGFRQARMMG
ncbi:MAG: fatty acid desaturase [Chloroflexi bacterium]|nr:fatty acid desaturase [Chloroflexota bacterium]